MTVFVDTTPCILFVSTKEMEKNYSLHFWYVQKMEAARFGEM